MDLFQEKKRIRSIAEFIVSRLQYFFNMRCVIEIYMIKSNKLIKIIEDGMDIHIPPKAVET